MQQCIKNGDLPTMVALEHIFDNKKWTAKNFSIINTSCATQIWNGVSLLSKNESLLNEK